MPPFYGFLSNCYTSALIDQNASVDWLPAPRFDGAAAFCRLLDSDHGGFCQVAPTSAYKTEQAYMPGTNILTTTFHTAGGDAEVTDYLVIGSTELRRVVKSAVPMRLVCKPRFNYGLIFPAIEEIEGRTVFINPQGEEAIVVVVAGNGARRSGLEEWELPPGEFQIIVHVGTSAGLHHPPDTEVTAAESLRRASAFWHSGAFGTYEGPERDAYVRSLLTIRGLTYRTNGAILAAATTSLPETIGAERQWDYRFVWVRDGSYGAEALLLAGEHVSVRRFLEFLLNCVNLLGKPFSCPFFRVDGNINHGETALEWLRGYRDSRPVRVGNGATTQTQLDIEGDLLWVLFRYARATGDLEFVSEYWWAIKALCRWVSVNWKIKDASLWEFRGQEDHYTHSLLMLWVALQCGADLADQIEHRDEAAAWRKTATDIAAFIREECVDKKENRFTQASGRSGVDAALLCLPLYGFCRVDDPTFLNTLKVIEQDLVQGDLVYRYRDDMMGKAVNPFTLASFWLARVYLRLGTVSRAQELMKRVGQCRTDLGLWSEHYNLQEDEPRGNFPQLFPHAGHVMFLEELQRLRGKKPLDDAFKGAGEETVALT